MFGQVIMEKIKQLVLKFLEKGERQTLKYRSIYVVCVVIHTFFIFLFSQIGLTQMVAFNIFSVIFYLLGIILAKTTVKTPVWIVLIYFEIVGHAVLCNFMLDWSYGFALYSLMVIPISYYLAYMHPKIKNANFFCTILAVINLGLMILPGFFPEREIKEFDLGLSSFVSSFNFVVSALVITTFSAIYVYEIRGTMSNLSEKNDELNFLANYDPLTKLRNRHHISDVFGDYEKGTKPFCVILGDIDDFKRINDTYSHDCGDKVLVTVSDVIRKNVGDKGVICRWGGEEILIIISGKSDECFELMENIRLEIQNYRMSFGIKQINVTMTFGFTDYSEEMSIEKLVSIADKRLYEGKRNGKNQIVYK